MEHETSHILLVEDSDTDAFLIEHAFRKARVANPLVRVDTGASAIRHLETLAGAPSRPALPVLLLLDLGLPDLSGYELLRWLRSSQEFRHLLVVVITGSDHPDEKLVAHTLGAQAFYRKHFRFEQLVAFVQTSGISWMVRTGPRAHGSGIQIASVTAPPPCAKNNRYP